MRMMITIGLLFSLFILIDCDDFYITPIEGNCTVNATNLSPCYTFENLIAENNLFLDLVRLYLLPGTHVISTFQGYHGIYSIAFHRWNKEGEVVIECSLRARLYFSIMTELSIISMHFVYCTLEFVFEYKRFDYASLTIVDGVFEKSKQEYAVILVNYAYPVMYATISNCTFVENNGAISFVASIYCMNSFLMSNTKFFLAIGETIVLAEVL